MAKSSSRAKPRRAGAKRQAAKIVSIKCSSGAALPIDALRDFQGGLKARTAQDIAMVRRSIVRYGFSFPFFVWKHGRTNYCFDGHGRIAALTAMREAGWVVPDLPVAYVQAKDEKEAKQKLLRLNSQFGVISKESLSEFASGMKVDWQDIKIPAGELIFESDVHIDLHADGFEIGKEMDVKDKVCPKCGYVLGKVAQKTGAKSYFGKKLRRDLH